MNNLYRVIKIWKKRKHEKKSVWGIWYQIMPHFSIKIIIFKNYEKDTVSIPDDCFVGIL